MSKKRCITSISILAILLILEIVFIKMNWLVNIDTAVYNFLAQFINPSVTKIVKIITFMGDEVFIVILCLIFLWKWKNKSRGVGFVFIIFLSTLFNHLLKIIVRRPRPDFPHLVIENSFSFPSGHTMAICAVVGVLLYYLWSEKDNNKIKVLISGFLVIAALLVMLSRIYLGVHYFSDVIGGLLASLLFLNVIYYYYTFYFKSPYFRK